MNKKYLAAILLLSIVVIISSCMKDDQLDPRAIDLSQNNIPTVTTKTVTSITLVSALCGGIITSDGGSEVTDYGVCWSTLPNPTVNDNMTNDGSGSGNYTSNVSNLSVGTKYYLRAYARNKNGIGYGGQQTFTTIATLQVGIEYAGGIIFYLDPTGVHGLVCSKANQSTTAAWGCTNTTVPGADGLTLGTGNENTIDIVGNCHSVGIAAEVCANHEEQGYTDWFLPSKDELKLMYNNLHLAHLGNFSNIAYWTSSEMTDVYAWQIAFGSGIVQGAAKGTGSGVRAIRAF